MNWNGNWLGRFFANWFGNDAEPPVPPVPEPGGSGGGGPSYLLEKELYDRRQKRFDEERALMANRRDEEDLELILTMWLNVNN